MYLPLNNFVNGKIISNGGPNNKLFSPKYLFLIFLTFIFCLYFLIQKWPNNSFINYQHFDNKKLINSNSNERKQSLEECIENDKNRSDTKWNSECCGEKMSYSFIIKTNDKLTEHMVSGRRFDCKHLPLLHKYKLADNYKIQQKIPVKKPGSNGFTIVTASDLRYFPRLHKLLYVLKKQFGCSQKIIVYDLGGMSEDKNTMELLNAVCALELRKFNWSIMPEDLRHLLVYAWKIYIIAEIYAKYDTFIWMDSAVVFNDTNPLNTIFEAMENEKISEAVMPRRKI
uniref:Nucleotide-diphospho-sugar transferase domain-containing protein n=1 Tax=Meloidogyne hapla TaxID=6305 RepID=A0A1I8BFR7_MELHA